jgi:hypothetical protein
MATGSSVFGAALSLAFALGVACANTERHFGGQGPGGAPAQADGGDATDIAKPKPGLGADVPRGGSASAGDGSVGGGGGPDRQNASGEGGGRHQLGMGGDGAAGPADTGGAGGAPENITPIVITFDTAVDDQPLPIDHAGLTWDSDWYTYHGLAQLYEPHSGAEFVTNLSKSSPLPFSFPQPVRFLGAWFSHYSGTTIQFEAFNAAGVSLGKSALLTQTLAPQFLSFDVGGVSKINVIWSGGSNPSMPDFSMDDVTYVIP